MLKRSKSAAALSAVVDSQAYRRSHPLSGGTNAEGSSHPERQPLFGRGGLGEALLSEKRPLPRRTQLQHGRGGAVSRCDHSQAYRRPPPLSGGTNSKGSSHPERQPLFGERGAGGGGASLRENGRSPGIPNCNMVAAALSAAVTTAKPIGDRMHSQAEPTPKDRPTLNASRSSGEGVWGRGASLREAASPPAYPIVTWLQRRCQPPWTHTSLSETASTLRRNQLQRIVPPRTPAALRERGSGGEALLSREAASPPEYPHPITLSFLRWKG